MKKDCCCFECQLRRFNIQDTEKIFESMQLAIKHFVVSQIEAKESLQRIGTLGTEDADRVGKQADNLTEFRDQLMDAYLEVFNFIRCASTLGDVLSLNLNVVDEMLDKNEEKKNIQH